MSQEATKPEEKLQTTTTTTQPKKPAHSAYYAHRILGAENQGGRAFERVAPGLRPEQKNQGMIILALVLLTAIIAVFSGIYAYQALHPPLRLVGICPQPATMSGNNCYTVSVVTIGTTITTSHVPAGYLLFPNGTKYGGR